MMPRLESFCLIALVLVSAALYCSLLPLWSGFDEPFHYGYVQSLSQNFHVPVSHRDYVSAEIEQSLALVAYSDSVPAGLRSKILADGWKRIDAEDSRLKQQTSTDLNYEAQQAPLSYVLLAPLDRLFSRLSLRRRILWLRLCLALASATCVLLSSNSLFLQLRLEGPFRLIALFLVASSQMMLATVAHVSNDWLAVPLMVAFFALLARFSEGVIKPRLLWALAIVFAAGLLTKAYFLAFGPVFVAAVFFGWYRRGLSLRSAIVALAVPAITAGPWYLRNKLVVGAFTGMQDAGVPLSSILTALWSTNWIVSLPSLLRWSLWTGNWQFLSFSRSTLNLELLLIAAAVVLYGIKRKQISVSEWWAIAAGLSFAAALLYDGALQQVFTHGTANHTEPYYAQGVFPFVWAIALLGNQRNGLGGRAVAILLLLVGLWVGLNTYVVKLVPFYGGMEGKATLLAVLDWWRHGSKALLASVAMTDLPVLYALTGLQMLLLIVCGGLSLKNMIERGTNADGST